MKISECMTRNVRVASPNDTLRDIAAMMAAEDFGAVPVGENDRLVGMVTDRDMVVRGLARDKGPDTAVRDVMSADIKYCFEDDQLDEVLENMGEIQVRRLPVLNRDKRLVGIVSLGDLAKDGATDTAPAGEALSEISQKGGEHSQSVQ